MKRSTFFLTLLGLLAGFTASAKAGPISTWYLTAGDQGTNWMVQGSSATSFAQAHPGNLGEYAIAVGSTVRTMGNGNDQVNLGAEYTLGGVYTGVDFTYPSGLRFYDGTRDAFNNYSVDFNNGYVYQMGLDWSNPTFLFDTGFGAGPLGITYDGTDSTMWVSQYYGSTVGHFSLGGTLLGSFSTGFSAISSLALDSADDTLWMGSQGTLGTFYQFSKTGALLSTETYGNMLNQNTLGGEFAFNEVNSTPEPVSMALLSLTGIAGIGLRVRRARRAQNTQVVV